MRFNSSSIINRRHLMAAKAICRAFIILSSHAVFALGGKEDASFACNPDNACTGVACCPDGKIVIVGQFEAIGNTRLNGCARILADGTVDATFRPPPFKGIPDDVFVLQDGRAMVWGNFSGPCVGLVRLNADGSVDASFDAKFKGDDVWIWDVAIQADGKVVVVGDFEESQSVACHRIARFNADGSLDKEFTLRVAKLSCNSSEIEIDSQGRLVLAGADLDSEFKNIFRLNSDGSLDESFKCDAIGVEPFNIRSLAISPSGQLLICGEEDAKSILDESSTKSTPKGRVVCIKDDGRIDKDFVCRLEGEVHVVKALPSGNFLAGGWFMKVNGQECAKICQITPKGRLDQNFRPEKIWGLSVDAISVDEKSRIIIGFSAFDGGVARLLANLQSDNLKSAVTNRIAAKPLYSPAALYPENLKKLGIEGLVEFEFVVLQDGSVNQVQIIQSPNKQFAAATVQAVAKWKFRPATDNGEAVKSKFRSSMKFVIK